MSIDLKNQRLRSWIAFGLKIMTLSAWLLLPTYAHPFTEGHLNVHPLHLDEEQNNDKALMSLRDEQGFLWIATDNGLKRYDGYQLRTFTLDPNDPTGIGSSNITALLLQNSGTLWAAGNTLNEYHPETETFSSYPVTGSASIRALYADPNGILWIGGEGFGLLGFSISTKEVVYSFFNKEQTRFISSIIAQKSSDLLWVSTNSGLYSFDTKTHKVTLYDFPLDYDVTNTVILSAIEDRNGTVWLATYEGLFALNPNTKKFKQYQKKPGISGALQTNTLQSLFEDTKGQIWIGTDKLGVYKYLPETDDFQHYPASPSGAHRFPPTLIHHIQEDSQGTLWFSAGDSGVYRITEHLEKFTTLQQSGKFDDSNNYLSYNNVLDLLEDSNGIIWIATDGGGLNRYNPKTQEFKHYRHNPKNPKSISGNSVLSLAEDSEGFIWAGTWNAGLNRLDPKTGTFTRISRVPSSAAGTTLSSNHIFRIEIAESGKLYLSTWNKGFQIYDPKTKTFESFTPQNSDIRNRPSNHSIHDFLIEGNGRHWIAGHTGLELFDPATELFTHIDIPGVDVIFDLHLDKTGSLWLATSKGLIRYHTATKITKSFSTNEGLIDNFVVSIEEDERGELWVGTRRGLSRFSPTTEEFSSFTKHDGLAGSHFNQYSHLKTKDGFMYFGGRDGLSIFRPKHLPTNEDAPTIQITSFEIFQEVIKPVKSPLLEKHINYTDELVLTSDQKDILFEFSALNFISPTKNLYKYRLDGLEEEWINATSNQRRARYTNLSPGKYIFQVLGSNNEGVWTGSAKEVRLTILPVWWQTWWARTIYLLSLLCTVYAFSVWRLRITHQHQKELEAIVQLRTQELKEANKAVSQLNSELEQRVMHRTKELSIEIEERRNAEQRSSHLAFHDPLTGLPNRSWILDHLEALINRSHASNSEFAVLFIGGDRFKQINDTHGHLLGDLLLVAASKRIKAILPKHYHVARLGSDEFTVVIDEIESQNQVVAVAEKILDGFKQPFVFEQAKMNFNVSIGILICTKEYDQPTQILRNVDIAMNHAKSKGRGIYQMFDADILEQTLEHASLQAELQQALTKNQFSVVFQPIIHLYTGSLSGFETLIRWNHPTRGMVPPDQFIPLAEEQGIIFDIGLWVLEQACKQLKSWHTEFGDHDLPSVAVNLSALQLKQADLLHKFDEIFSKIGLLKEKIKLEITESALMENTATVDQLLESFRQRGIELAIDDFGTGYSSLSYLDKLPVQVLKIDRSFVNALFDEDNKTDGAHEIVRATIALAHNLKMRVVAEGIETEDQLEVLKAYRCDYGQGYLISRPLSPQAATEFLIDSRS